jgi:hypothetical protein
MPGNLNLALVLRADTSGFKGEMRQAAAAVDQLGGAAGSAGKSIGAQVTEGATKATRGLGGVMRGIAGDFTRLAADMISSGSRVGQAAAGIGAAIGSAFSPVGTVIGTVVASVGVGLVQALFSASNAAEETADAVKGVDAAIKSFSDTVGKGVKSAQDLAKAYAGANAEFRDLGILKYRSELDGLGKKSVDVGRQLEEVRGELEEIASARLAPGGELRGLFGGAAAAGEAAKLRATISAEQAAAVQSVLGRGAIDVQSVAELQAAFRGASGEAAGWSSSCVSWLRLKPNQRRRCGRCARRSATFHRGPRRSSAGGSSRRSTGSRRRPSRLPERSSRWRMTWSVTRSSRTW